MRPHSEILDETYLQATVPGTLKLLLLLVFLLLLLLLPLLRHSRILD